MTEHADEQKSQLRGKSVSGDAVSQMIEEFHGNLLSIFYVLSTGLGVGDIKVYTTDAFTAFFWFISC